MSREQLLTWSDEETHLANGIMTAGIPGGERLVRILIVNATANAITGLSIGTKATGTDVINAQNIPAKDGTSDGRYDHEANSGAGQLFYISGGQDLYISASNWNGATVSVYVGRTGLQRGR